MANARLYRFWGNLTEALKTGKPQNEVKHTGKPMFDELYADPDRLEQFIIGMAGISAGSFHAFATIAKRAIEASGLSDQVTTAGGSFLTDPLPKADVITMGLILHDWNLEGKMHLIQAACDALPPGGVLVAIENVVGDAFDFTGADFTGADYTGADSTGWCTEVGFARTEIVPLAGAASAAIAYK